MGKGNPRHIPSPDASQPVTDAADSHRQAQTIHDLSMALALREQERDRLAEALRNLAPDLVSPRPIHRLCTHSACAPTPHCRCGDTACAVFAARVALEGQGHR